MEVALILTAGRSSCRTITVPVSSTIFSVTLEGTHLDGWQVWLSDGVVVHLCGIVSTNRCQ
jgi:hypothetical protein